MTLRALIYTKGHGKVLDWEPCQSAVSLDRQGEQHKTSAKGAAGELMSSHSKQALPAITVAAIGVVFGDIGTSPLYALKEIFNGHHPIPVTPENILGVLSLVFWAIIVLVTIKYVAIIMRADNRGEGGSLALLALVTERAKNPRLSWIITLLGIFAAALFYGDSMITPAISVLSAVEGMEIITPTLTPYVIPITLGILTGLFFIQKRGTGAVGIFFGPVMVAWFGILAVLGLNQIASNPAVLLALNPLYAIVFIGTQPVLAFLALGSVVLAVTGEKRSIRTWVTSDAFRFASPGSVL
jgi:KUP system potassium uptake protein